MIKKLDVIVNPKEYQEINWISFLSEKLKVSKKRIRNYQIIKRSIDARNKNIKLVLQVLVFLDESTLVEEPLLFQPLPLHNGKQVIIVGMGPAGLFAALTLLNAGIKPILIEQGKDVSSRKRDIAQMYRTQRVNELSNYCFGEGGAGTFSDGKLYTRSVKRGDVNWFLKILVQAGANRDILINAHPHIGSDKLPSIVINIRNWIIDAGGEIHFSAKLTDLIVENGACKGIVVNNKDKIYADAVIIATGHSSRMVYELLNCHGAVLQPKGFAVGVRLEHPQHLINHIQYHGSKYIQLLPPAEYKIVEQVEGRGVYSFCMCPGGTIVPSMTEPQTIVVNGMSAAKRNSPYANSGFVVEIRPEDITSQATVWDMLHFQSNIEKLAYQAVSDGMKAPAQRIVDFLHSRISSALPSSSYLPRLVSSPMHEWFPDLLSKKLKGAIENLKRRMPLFVSSDAIMVGVESRTSSPVRIPRNMETFEQMQIRNLYPCGEGAGYAGGITSSALDGMNVANAIIRKLIHKSKP